MEVFCANCSKPFEARRSTAKFCSTACRVSNARPNSVTRKPVTLPPNRGEPPPDGWEDPFLETLAICGKFPAACLAAGVLPHVPLRRRKTDPAFAELYDEAEQLATKILEAEAWRRAAEGYPKGVYHKGELVATEMQYSDTLMVTMLKARDPAKYRESHRVDANVRATGDSQVQVIFDFGVPHEGADSL